MNNLVSTIKQIAADCGYLDCGIASAEPFELFARELKRRSELFPEAAPLYTAMENRTNPQKNAPWANAIIVTVRRYGKYKLPNAAARHIGRNYLADRRVPSCPDHQMPHRMTAALKDLGLRVKGGGVPDRLAGARAGVTAIGRNNFAYHPRAGSWINIESWRVDAPLPPDQPNFECPCPENCRACIKACPTQALDAPYNMRIDHCVAHLTYRAPRPIAAELRQAMGQWIYGCDDCQLACPLNHDKWERKEPMPWLEPIKHLLNPEALAEIDETTFRQSVFPLFWYIPETDVERWRANARRAMQVRSINK